MSTLAEPYQKHPPPVLTGARRRIRTSAGRRSYGCLYAEGKLIETRERLPEYQYIRVCELTYDLEGSESPLTRQYIVTY